MQGGTRPGPSLRLQRERRRTRARAQGGRTRRPAKATAPVNLDWIGNLYTIDRRRVGCRDSTTAPRDGRGYRETFGCVANSCHVCRDNVERDRPSLGQIKTRPGVCGKSLMRFNVCSPLLANGFELVFFFSRLSRMQVEKVLEAQEFLAAPVVRVVAPSLSNGIHTTVSGRGRKRLRESNAG